MSEYQRGLRKGIPIALGYLSVSFTFGVKAVHGGIPSWIAVLISLTNLTSAGQLAGAELMIAGGTYLEIALATLIINLRYMLMSFSLSQKLDKAVRRGSCFLFGFGITDEIFAVSVTEPGTVSAPFLYGLMTTPMIGWVSGTFLGAVASGMMPTSLGNAMELGLYAMFIAIIVPPAKKNYKVLCVILMAIIIECILYYVPVFQFISGGFKVILATLIAAALAATFMPVEEMRKEEGQ